MANNLQLVFVEAREDVAEGSLHLSGAAGDRPHFLPVSAYYEVPSALRTQKIVFDVAGSGGHARVRLDRPARAGVGGRACLPVMLVAPQEFRICSAYVPPMFRMVSADPVATLTQPRVRPKSSQWELYFAYSAPASAGVEGGPGRLPC